MRDSATLGATAESRPWAKLARSLPRNPTRRQFVRQGFVQIERVWSASFAEGLSGEAHHLASKLRLPQVGKRRSSSLDVRPAPSLRPTADLAPYLARFHFSLVPLARALTGRMLIPAYAWYNYYASNDAIWLHVDVDGSELALLTTAVGEIGPLHFHPELREATQEELDAIQSAANWDPDSGRSLAYPPLGLLALRGDVVPHHRPGKAIFEPAVVAALHYRSIF